MSQYFFLIFVCKKPIEIRIYDSLRENQRAGGGRLVIYYGRSPRGGRRVTNCKKHGYVVWVRTITELQEMKYINRKAVSNLIKRKHTRLIFFCLLGIGSNFLRGTAIGASSVFVLVITTSFCVFLTLPSLSLSTSISMSLSGSESFFFSILICKW